METSKLFEISAEGYNCAQVEEYISVLRSEYQKIFDYAKGLEVQLMSSDEKAPADNGEEEKLAAKGAELAARASELEAKEAELKKREIELENEAEILSIKTTALEKRTAEIEKKAASVERKTEHHKEHSSKQDENGEAVFKTPSGGEKNYETLFRSLSVMTLLSEEVVRENQELRQKLSAYEN